MAPTRQKSAAPPQVLPNGHDTTTETDTTQVDDALVEVDGTDAGTEAATQQQTETQVDPGVAALQEQLEAEKRKNANLEAERDQLRNERQADNKVLTDSRLLVIESTITTKETQKKEVMQRLKDAKEAGDTDAEIAATDELQNLNLELRTAKLGKDRLEQQIEEAKAEPADKLEAWFNDNNVGQESRNWLRSHPEYMSDPAKNDDLSAAHFSALGKKLKVNTPAYFEHIETELGLRGGEQEVEQRQEPGAQQERQQAAPSAPVSRGGAGGRSKYGHIAGVTDLGGGKVRVSREIAEAAQISGLTITEYLDQAATLTRGSDGQLH